MFIKFSNPTKFTNRSILKIEDVVEYIRNNPNKDRIKEVQKLKLTNKESYDNRKLKFPSVLAHVISEGLKLIDVIDVNSYIYFDIDGLDKSEVDPLIDEMWNKYPITLICKSFSGLGISFLIKVEDLSLENFKVKYYSIAQSLLIDGYPIDTSAGGIVRKWILPYDPNVRYRSGALWCAPALSTLSPLSDVSRKREDIDTGCLPISPAPALSMLSPSSDTMKEKEDIDTGCLPIKKRGGTGCLPISDKIDALFSEPIIPIGDLLQQINIESKYEFDFDNKPFIIEKKKDYHYIFPPENIPDGMKHTKFISYINSLIYLNPNITLLQVYSFIHYINDERCNPKMRSDMLVRLVINLYDRVLHNGPVVKTKEKLVHFNPDYNLTINQKQSIGQQVSAKLQTNKTITDIQHAIPFFEKKGIRPTKKRLAEKLNVSERTIQRRWKQELSDPYDIVIPEGKPDKVNINKQEDYIIDTIISFDDFFDE